MAPMKATVEETGKQVGAFMSIMRDQPLSLALVLMNFLLMFFLFYSASGRKDTVGMIVKWQQDTDRLMASCVSMEVMKLVLDSSQKVIEAENTMRKLLLEHDKTRAGTPREIPETAR